MAASFLIDVEDFNRLREAIKYVVLRSSDDPVLAEYLTGELKAVEEHIENERGEHEDETSVISEISAVMDFVTGGAPKDTALTKESNIGRRRNSKSID